MNGSPEVEVLRDTSGPSRRSSHVSDAPSADSRTARFEGRAHGSGVSFFLVDNEPGQGPGRHRHPYSETWVVLEGQATITIDGARSRRGGRRLRGRAGRVCGTASSTPAAGALRMICIHASDVMVQEGSPPPR